MQNLWDACLRRLEQELPAQQFNTWIRPLAPEADAGADTLVLAAPNRFVLELVRERFIARIERLPADASGPRRVSATAMRSNMLPTSYALTSRNPSMNLNAITIRSTCC